MTDHMTSSSFFLKGAMENQMHQLRAGRDLSSLERVPNPVVPIPPQLAMMMMRPSGFYPMMSFPRPPFGVGGMPRPPVQMGPVPVSMNMVSVVVQ